MGAQDDATLEARKYWDPARFFTDAPMPMLWVNGDNDPHFSVDTMSRSHVSAGPASILSIHPRMPHGHGAGWEVNMVPEIYALADHLLKGTGAPLARIRANASRRKPAEGKDRPYKRQQYRDHQQFQWNAIPSGFIKPDRLHRLRSEIALHIHFTEKHPCECQHRCRPRDRSKSKCLHQRVQTAEPDNNRLKIFDRPAFSAEAFGRGRGNESKNDDDENTNQQDRHRGLAEEILLEGGRQHRVVRSDHRSPAAASTQRGYFIRSNDFCRICQSFNAPTLARASVFILFSSAFFVGRGFL